MRIDINQYSAAVNGPIIVVIIIKWHTIHEYFHLLIIYKNLPNEIVKIAINAK